MSTPDNDRLRAWAKFETGTRKLAVDYLISAGFDFNGHAFVPSGGGHAFDLLDDAVDYQMGIDDEARAS